MPHTLKISVKTHLLWVTTNYSPILCYLSILKIFVIQISGAIRRKLIHLYYFKGNILPSKVSLNFQHYVFSGEHFIWKPHPHHTYMTVSVQSNLTEFHPNKYFVITSHYDLLWSIKILFSPSFKRGKYWSSLLHKFKSTTYCFGNGEKLLLLSF